MTSNNDMSEKIVTAIVDLLKEEDWRHHAPPPNPYPFLSPVWLNKPSAARRKLIKDMHHIVLDIMDEKEDN